MKITLKGNKMILHGVNINIPHIEKDKRVFKKEIK